MSRSIPDRWIPYKACGKVIEGTRFICFKVPLRTQVQQNNSEIKEIWDVKTLLSTIPNLGAVIDLTNTARYYDPRELVAAGVLHKKILMPGRIIPPEPTVIEFMDAVDEFLGKDCAAKQVRKLTADATRPNQMAVIYGGLYLLVGVHCTHGLNRTGYMVCRYMRDRMSIDGRDAINRFELARGYQIERENYIADILGNNPPPPHLSGSTEVKPIENGVKDMLSESTQAEKSEDSRKKSKKSKSKEKRNGENGDRRRRSRDYDDDNDTSNPGRYVRHPSRQHDRDSRRVNSGGTSSSYREREDHSRRRNRHSSDSDRSYDFKYDY